MIIWALIPVKPLQDSKSRLVDVLAAEERAALTSHILSSTIKVLKHVSDIARVLVVSRDPKVLKLARRQGASTFDERDKQGLNSAITRAAQIAAAKHADGVLIIPADLPFVSSADIEKMIAFTREDQRSDGQGDLNERRQIFAICSDHKRDGSNALLVCPPTGFTFQYGPSSFHLHLKEAARLGLPARIIETSGLKFDIDTEEDWNAYLSMQMNHVASS